MRSEEAANVSFEKKTKCPIRVWWGCFFFFCKYCSSSLPLLTCTLCWVLGAGCWVLGALRWVVVLGAGWLAGAGPSKYQIKIANNCSRRCQQGARK